MSAYETNYGGYCSNCGSTSECSCGCNSGYRGCEYPSCGPDYNPINTNNSFCPNIEGSSCQGGSATGNNSCVNVSLCGNGCKDDDCCCKEGVKKLIDFLYDRSVDTGDITGICIYGDLIPSDIKTDTQCTKGLLDIDGANIMNISKTDDFIRSGSEVVSICAISVIKFTATEKSEILKSIKLAFHYKTKCNCCCDCGPGIADALYTLGIGVTYNLIIKDSLEWTTGTGVTGLAKIEAIKLVAIEENISIFSVGTTNVYIGIPTCKIAKIY